MADQRSTLRKLYDVLSLKGGVAPSNAVDDQGPEVKGQYDALRSKLSDKLIDKRTSNFKEDKGEADRLSMQEERLMAGSGRPNEMDEAARRRRARMEAAGQILNDSTGGASDDQTIQEETGQPNPNKPRFARPRNQ